MGSAPGFDVNEDHGYQLITVASVFSVLCIAVVIARVYATKKKNAPLWWDDYMCFPALLFCLASNAIAIIFVQVGGVGHHVASFGRDTEEVLLVWGKCIFAQEILYSFAIVLPKLVILLFYFRLFPNKHFRLACYVVGFLVIGWGISCFFTAIFQCRPTAYAWDKKIANGTCVDLLAYYRYISLPNAILDAVMLAMPVRMVWQLQITRRQKLALSGVFLLGGMGLIASIVRVGIFFRNDAFKDRTWTSVQLLIWTVVEVSVVLIAACLPTLRPLFVGLWRETTKISSKTHASNKQPDSYVSYSGHGGPPKQGFSRINDSRKSNGNWDNEPDGVPLKPLQPPNKQWAGARIV